jgi:hypothetical protein
MNKALSMLIVILAVMVQLVGSALAVPITINDTYIGGTPSTSFYSGKDVVGSPLFFDISKMEVEFSGNQMTVKIYSKYFDYVGLYGTQLGDLFISTNGYHTYTPSTQDTSLNGESWEYALALNTHMGSSGTAALYSLTGPGDVRLSYVPPGYAYRANQEVQYKGSGSSLGTGSWSINTVEDYLSMAILMPGTWNGVSEFGFHWAMTCANDVIEGGVTGPVAPVPEPATLVLLGFGLIGIAGLGRRMRSKTETQTLD